MTGTPLPLSLNPHCPTQLLSLVRGAVDGRGRPSPEDRELSVREADPRKGVGTVPALGVNGVGTGLRTHTRWTVSSTL